MTARFRDPKVAVSIVFVAAAFLSILDATIVNVALPDIARHFDADAASASAIASAYLVSLAVFIPVAGWLADRFGDKRVLLTAIGAFSFASALCGFAGSLTELVLFRVLQGIGGGMLTPVGMAMVVRAFPPSERARVARILIIPTAAAPALGPVIGGLLVDQASWEWIFFVNVPIGAAALLFGLRFLEERRADDAGRFDVGGFLLAGAGLGGLMYALSNGPSDGWGSAGVLVPGVAGILLLIWLCRYELANAAPMLEMRLLRGQPFGISTVTNLVGFAAFLGTLYAFTQMQQLGFGRDPLEAGLLTFPEALGVMLWTQVASRIYPRVGPRRLTVGGLVGIAVFALALALQTPDTPLAFVVVVMFAFGASMGNVFLALQTAAFARIGPAQTGQASSLFNATRQAGSAFGVAVLATVIASRGAMTPAGADLGPYHAAFVVAAGVALVAALLALGIRDADAEATMATAERREPPVAEPVAMVD